jgi:3-mercaptopyruvate sulfurtransferase SseA
MCSLTTTTTATTATARKKKEAKVVDEHFKLPAVCDADTLRSLIRRKKLVRVVDVRRAEDYQRDHIYTAVSLPLSRVLENDQPEKIVAFLEELGISDSTPVVVYDDTFGALAARVAWTFQYVGHDNTALLEMTFKRWKELGLESALFQGPSIRSVSKRTSMLMLHMLKQPPSLSPAQCLSTQGNG